MSKPWDIENTKDDISYSMIVDSCSPTNKSYIYKSLNNETSASLSRIQSRQRSSWVDDRSVKACFSCQTPFSFYIRTHHCRKCGNVFCYKCSKHRVVIPDNVGKIPTEPNYLKNTVTKMIWSTEKVRVCNECALEIEELKSLEQLFQVFDLLPLTIKDYHTIKMVCKTWNKVGNYYLSKFREIQYKLPYQPYTPIEKKLLTNSRDLLVGHSLWTTALIRAGLLDSTEHCEQSETCRKLMCSRICNDNLTPSDAITLLATARRRRSLLVEILDILDVAPIKEISNYLPLIIQELAHHPDTNIITNFLIKQARKDMLIAGEIYWESKIKIDSNKLSMQTLQLLQSLQKRLLNNLDEKTVKYLEDTEALIMFLNSLPKKATLDKIKRKFIDNKRMLTGIRVPTQPHLICKKIKVDDIKIKDSASRPIFLPMECWNENTEKYCNYYLLYKFEDVRQDLIATKTIRMMDLILKRELIKEPMEIITYNVFPTSKMSGLIEIIPNCHTLFEIQKKFTILNYILENNRSSGLNANELRNRFLRSCAGYCVMTYLLGVGDRHLDNIMVNREGYLFHIDYGFIIGADPKPMKYPTMRITKDMVDAIGGPESRYYREFVELAKNIHLCLQKRLPIFYTMLHLLVTIEPPIKASQLTEDDLINELSYRFMYGENYEQTGEQLSVHISNSSGSYNQAIIDFFHYHQQEHTLNNMVNSTVGWLSSWFTG